MRASSSGSSRGQRASGAAGEDLSDGRRLGWHSPDGSGQRLMVLTAEPGTPSCERLHILTSWNAEPSTGLGAEHASAQ